MSQQQPIPPPPTPDNCPDDSQSKCKEVLEVECPVCSLLMREPKSLRCGHSLCAQCVGKLIAAQSPASRANSIKCPLCKAATPLKSGGSEDAAGGLPTNYALRGGWWEELEVVG
jgi:zinc finger of C3HC4-type, RING